MELMNLVGGSTGLDKYFIFYSSFYLTSYILSKLTDWKPIL